MIKIFTGVGGMEAHFVRNLLEESGIRAQVMGDLLGAARGELPLTNETLPSVWINEEDMNQAQDILQEYRQRKDEDNPLRLDEEMDLPDNTDSDHLDDHTQE